MRFFLILCFFCFSAAAFADEKILNIYAWSDEIPSKVIQQFEKETGIKINLSTYENNEVMYAKLRANKHSGYDVVNPSSYYVDRMQKLGLLAKLDKSKLPNLKNINPSFMQADYDPGLNFSVPHVSGITGIFVNQTYYSPQSITRWEDLWQTRFNNQLMLLDDMREVFSLALLTLGYSVNDRDPAHIKLAFLKLKDLMRNVKVFSSETVTSIIIDEDATVGMAWNGDAFKATRENPAIHFIFPQEGFVLWVDNFVILENAPHKENAYLFINFMLRPEIAKEVALATSFSTTNLAAQQLLPDNIRHNPTIYPPAEVLKKGQYQKDIGDETLSLMEKYWEELKMSG